MIDARTRTAGFMCALFVACAFFSFGLAGAVRAETEAELQTQIDDRTSKISQVQAEIDALQKQLDDTGKQKQTLQSAIKTLDLSNKKLTAQITLTQTQISKTDLQIRTLSSSIATTSDRVDEDMGGVAGLLRSLNHNDASPAALILLSGGTLSSMFDEAATLAATRDTLREKIDDLQDLKTSLETDRNVAQKKRNELAALKADLAGQKKALAATIADKNTLLTQTKNQESSYQSLIAQKKAQQAEFEQELLDFQNKLTGKVDESTLPTEGSEALSWPLASIRVTQFFGNTDFASQHAALYNGHGHAGVDFAASPGTPVFSSASGVVMGVGDTDVTCRNASYGKWVLIKHSNGLATLYAHLSLISVSKGQTISVHQTLGYSGSTGYATGPHLHYTVFAGDLVQVDSLPSQACKGKTYTIPVAPLDAYLNPFSYLPKL